MKNIYSSPDLAEIHIRANILEENGIDFIIKNPHSNILMGAVAYTDTWLQLWIVDDEDIDKAKELLQLP